MSIKYAILGLLSWKPSTGYDLKKIFEQSSSMYWSGNNNQIYKTLVQLLDESLVTNETLHQENSPSKKIYTITPKGSAELGEWVRSSPEVPELRKTFLIQLAWADSLNTDELDGLLSRYEYEVEMQLLMQQEQQRRGLYSPKRTRRETYLWDMIGKNILSSYKNELDWVHEIRKELKSFGG
jgi:PadR family transcriptional regulator, regulatory protein AphA